MMVPGKRCVRDSVTFSLPRQSPLQGWFAHVPTLPTTPPRPLLITDTTTKLTENVQNHLAFPEGVMKFPFSGAESDGLANAWFRISEQD